MSTLTTAAPQTVRILGIDPGLQTTGFGVLDMTGSRLQYVASGVIETTRGDMGNLPARLKVIYCCWGRRGAVVSRLWCPAICRWPNTPPCR
jgi:hypothetical protein